MKTNDLITSALSQKMKWKKTQTNDVLNAFIEIIRKNLSEINDIELLDIGLLENRIKEQKVIVNPKTHRKILYPPKKVLELKVSKQLQEHLKNNRKMKIITKEDIIKQLSEQTNLPQEQIEIFVEKLNSVIIEKLETDKSVNIEGLGELRLVWSNYHKNTKLREGEPTEFYKLRFEAEEQIKELVNKEFSFLTPVDLTEASEDIPMNALSKQAEEIKDILSEIQEVDVEAITNTESGTSSMVIESGSIVIESNISESPKIDTIVTEHSEPTNTILSYPRTFEVDTIEDYSSDDVVIKDSRRWLWILLISIGVGILVGGFVFFNYKYNFVDFDMLLGSKVDKTIDEEVFPDTIDSTAMKNTDRDTLFFENRRYDEFIDTVKVTEGVTLVQLSLKYYGNKVFWVYIYEANKDILPSANHIALGTKIKIPSMPNIFIDPNDTFVMNNVKKLKNRYVE